MSSALADPQPQTHRRFSLLTDGGVMLLVIMASALAMSPSVADPDLWGHVQYGRDFLQTGRIAETNTYSFTAENYRWINHENLSEIVMAWTVDRMGAEGLIAGKFLLSLFVIISIVWFNLRRGVGMTANAVLVLLVAWNLEYHWSFRPQVASFVCFTLMVLLLQWGFDGWRDRWHLNWLNPKWLTRSGRSDDLNYNGWRARLLWLVPIVICLWTNAHGGFAAGLLLYWAYLGCRAIEALAVRGSGGWGLVRRMILMAIVAGLAVLLNPYSYHLPMWLLEALSRPRPEIMDWATFQLWTLVGLKFWALLAVVVLALAFSRRSLDFTQTVLLSITLWESVSHFRHVPFFAILCGFWLGPHLESLLARFHSKPAPRFQWATRLKGRLAIAAAIALLMGFMGYRLTDRLSQLRVDRQAYPVDAFQFMQDHRLRGKMVVTFDWAQYALAAFCVDRNLAEGEKPSRVAFDGRFETCYPQQIMDMNFDFTMGAEPGVPRFRSPDSPPCDPGRVLELGEPDLVVLRRIREISEQHMQQYTDRWTLLYQDSLAQIWGRSSRYDDPSSPDYFPHEQRKVTDRQLIGYVDWPAFPTRSSGAGSHETKLVNISN